jgi:probable HAF family extracellular repeat protein
MLKRDAKIARSFTISLLLVSTIALLTTGLPDGAAAQTVSFQGLGFLPGGGTSIATGVSGDGTVVVGWGTTDSSSQEAFSWTGGAISGLGFPGGGTTSTANGVNSNGTVISGIGRNIGSNWNVAAPVIWTSGTPMLLPQNINCCGSPPPPCGAGALGVNANATGPTSSVLVGADGSGSPGCGPGIPIEWVNGTEVAFLGWSPPQSGEAAGVNADGSVIVGRYGGEAFRWKSSDGTIPEILGDLGGGSSEAYAANADGSVVVGTAAVDNVNSKAFRWTASTGLVGLGPAAIYSEALAVNGDGSVVVGQMHNNGPAFRWTAATGFQNLQALLTANGVDITKIGPAPNNTWTGLTQATGISADGTTIVGFGGGPGAATQAWIAILPVGATNQTDTHDFNHAGTSDLLWRDSGGDVALWLMNGSQISQAGSLGSVPTVWSIIGQRDFTGDGNSDLLWRDTSGDLAMWFMNGLQVSSSAGLGNVPTNWTVAGTGDLNSDGMGDLIWRDKTSGTVAAWFMNGAQVTGTANFGVVPNTWTILASDAHGDILWQDTSGNLAIWQVHGSQIVASAGLGNVPSNWKVAGVGDFNGDGSIDILWRDSTSGTVAIWFLNGTQVQSTASLGAVDPSVWTIAQTGDYNGDGMSDILWIDNTGNVAVWFMNSATISSSAGLGNVGTSWSVQAQNAE